MTLGSALGRNTQNFNRAVFNPLYFYSVGDTKSSMVPSKESDKLLCFSAAGLTGHVHVSDVCSPLARGISLLVSQPCISRSGDREVGTHFTFARGVPVSALSRRYVRFFPDGHVMMLTTPEEPQSIVPRLRTRNTRWWPSAVSCPLHVLGGSLQIM